MVNTDGDWMGEGGMHRGLMDSFLLVYFLSSSLIILIIIILCDTLRWISLRRLPSGDLRWSDGLEESVTWIPPNGDSPIDAGDGPCFILDSSVNVRYSISCRRRHSVICKQFAGEFSMSFVIEI